MRCAVEGGCEVPFSGNGREGRGRLSIQCPGWSTGGRASFIRGSAQVSHLLSERALMSLADVSAWRCEAGVGLSWSIHARRALLNSISKVFQIHPREHLCKASNIIVATLKTAW